VRVLLVLVAPLLLAWDGLPERLALREHACPTHVVMEADAARVYYNQPVTAVCGVLLVSPWDAIPHTELAIARTPGAGWVTDWQPTTIPTTIGRAALTERGVIISVNLVWIDNLTTGVVLMRVGP
jgi:hypothetical protein